MSYCEQKGNFMSSWNQGSEQRGEYLHRINKVQDYIENHLCDSLSLEELSRVAKFSPFHFHRIFSAFAGETLFQFIQRVRLEKAAFLLLADNKREITAIALDCGFSNQASFAKAFKALFGMNASLFRTTYKLDKGDEGQRVSNLGKVSGETVCYNNPVRRNHDEKRQQNPISYYVDVERISDIQAVYVRHKGPYKQNAALFEKLYYRLYEWAQEKGLYHPDSTRWLTLFHDQTDLTPDNKLRISLCMTVPGDVRVDGEIGLLTIPGGKYAVGHFELTKDQYQQAWEAMMLDWLPDSGYQPDDRYCFEFYPDNNNQTGVTQRVDIHIPIKPLSS